MKGFPVFFVAKEGALPGEETWLNYNEKDIKNFIKVNHTV